MTVYLALILVAPLRLICMMATIFLVIVRAKIFAVSAVADHAWLLTSVCVIVAKLAKFRVQTAARINERMPTMLEGMVVFVAVEAKPLVFPEGTSASEQ